MDKKFSTLDKEKTDRTNTNMNMIENKLSYYELLYTTKVIKR